MERSPALHSSFRCRHQPLGMLPLPTDHCLLDLLSILQVLLPSQSIKPSTGLHTVSEMLPLVSLCSPAQSCRPPQLRLEPQEAQDKITGTQAGKQPTTKKPLRTGNHQRGVSEPPETQERCEESSGSNCADYQGHHEDGQRYLKNQKSPGKPAQNTKA